MPWAAMLPMCPMLSTATSVPLRSLRPVPTLISLSGVFHSVMTPCPRG